MNEPYYYAPTFWVALSFCVFMLLVLKPVCRYIARGLDGRSNRIGQELAEAKRLREEAQELLAEYQRRQQESLKESEAMLARVEAEAARMAEQAETELKASLEKRRALSVEKIAQAESKALQDVQNHVVDIAIAAARTLIQQHLTHGGSNEELIAQATAELERKLH